MIEERTIPARSHGRYLVVASASADRRPHTASATPQLAPLLVGFHGYSEDAAAHLNRLRSIPGSDRWIIVSIQGLHRFYRGRSSDVVASWMTRQDRELMIADNVEYASAVIDAVSNEWPANATLVLAGFSQGVATAYRVSALGRHRTAGLLAVGADVPPELDSQALARVASVLIGHGLRDEIYSADKLKADQSRLEAASVRVAVQEFNAGHEWTPEYSAAASKFLGQFLETEG